MSKQPHLDAGLLRALAAKNGTPVREEVVGQSFLMHVGANARYQGSADAEVYAPEYRSNARAASAKVNWAALGATTPEEARRVAFALLKAADIADDMNGVGRCETCGGLDSDHEVGCPEHCPGRNADGVGPHAPGECETCDEGVAFQRLLDQREKDGAR